jgi:hypothetical protein
MVLTDTCTYMARVDSMDRDSRYTGMGTGTDGYWQLTNWVNGNGMAGSGWCLKSKERQSQRMWVSQPRGAIIKER